MAVWQVLCCVVLGPDNWITPRHELLRHTLNTAALIPANTAVFQV